MADDGNNETSNGPTDLSAKHPNLKFWPKGVSGNPKGRPKSVATRIAEMTRNGDELLERLVQVARGELQGFHGRERLEAQKRLEERLWGKAPDISVNVTAAEDVGAAIVELSKEQLVALASQPVDINALPASQAVVEAVPEALPEAIPLDSPDIKDE